jgi:L-lysine epsilon oxidase-like protein
VAGAPVETEKSRRIRTARIHPSIGVARLGNSPNDCFIGPEVPGVYEYPEGGFRDERYRLKRQGARFRIFGYDDHDQVVEEITEAGARIEWRVHLKNTKAAGRKFAGVLHPDEELRNAKWLNAGNDERQLILDPNLQKVWKEKATAKLRCRRFMGVDFDPVLELGRMLYEEGTGRLIVLGGLGRAGTPHPKIYKLEHGDFANHDGWFDDISDGVVTAKVILQNGRNIYVKPAWVVVGPPKFAPELQSVVTLYDTLYQVALDRNLLADPFSDPRFLPSFNRDIYPILRRALEMRWVFAKSYVGHTFELGPETPENRVHIFRQFRVPSAHPKEPGTGTGRMPFAWSDLYNEPSINGTVTPLQYKMLSAWAAGNFQNDWGGNPPPLSFDLTPSGLDRAALEACVGAAFYPGIEVSWKMRDVFNYIEPFRLDPESLSPGDISQQMSLPWQTDFVDCTYEDPFVWWPAQRPIDVRTQSEPGYVAWASSFEKKKKKKGPKNNPPKKKKTTPNVVENRRLVDMEAEEMVGNFFRLGHVLRSGNEFFETGRVKPGTKKVKKENVRNFKRG